MNSNPRPLSQKPAASRKRKSRAHLNEYNPEGQAKMNRAHQKTRKQKKAKTTANEVVDLRDSNRRLHRQLEILWEDYDSLEPKNSDLQETNHCLQEENIWLQEQLRNQNAEVRRLRGELEQQNRNSNGGGYDRYDPNDSRYY